MIAGSIASSLLRVSPASEKPEAALPAGKERLRSVPPGMAASTGYVLVGYAFCK